MKNKIILFKQKVIENDKIIFYVISLIFFLIFSFAYISDDDISGMPLVEKSFLGYYETLKYLYEQWMSRVLVIGVVLFFRNNCKIFWAIYMAVCAYVMMVSISLLFVRKNKRECNNFIACFFMQFPFSILCSAGWISTMTTYFSPMAFGFLALVPISKIVRNEKIEWWEYILYAIANIYSSNSEQVMVVILGSYLVAAIYLIAKKNSKVFIYIQLAIAVFSLGFIFSCPGNYVRFNSEVASWYSEYEMLSFIDKAEMGYTSSLNWLLYNSHVFVIVICLFLTLFVWKKYKELTIRIISLIPTISVIILGPLNDFFITLFPSLEYLSQSISKYGLVTTQNRGNFATFMQFFVMTIIIAVILLEICLLASTIEEILVPVVLIATGFASRVSIGFSPTIWASEYRTCTVMCGCIIVTFIYIFLKQYEKYTYHSNMVSGVKGVLNIVLIIEIINLCGLIGTQFA